ncbi:hypothetical protein [Fodinicola feengrottensis]|uniref:Uncharacterized protein n=1 Tax=Fodinicola feengrottensis TaxID=435914 RepID=A0ABN2IC93_9ACTN|nr:hypothetical protein [Fodinicola feengrottensis]
MTITDLIDELCELDATLRDKADASLILSREAGAGNDGSRLFGKVEAYRHAADLVSALKFRVRQEEAAARGLTVFAVAEGSF